LNAYELTFIIRPDLDEENVQGTVGQVVERVQRAGGEIVATFPWRPPRRRMAYPIRDFGDGFYTTTVFRIESPSLGEIENWLKLNESVLRFLLVAATEQGIRHAQHMQHQAQTAPAPQPPAQPAPVGTPAPQPAAAVPQDATQTPQPEEAPAEAGPAEAAPTEAAPVEPVTTEAVPAEATPAEVASAEATPSETTTQPTEEQPAQPEPVATGATQAPSQPEE
jgi:small subunit ribosomal protein S6